jgi:hypothetical protein
MRFLKRIIISILFLTGVLFLYEGFGFEFRILNYQVLTDYGIPIGSAFLVFGVLIALTPPIVPK